MDMYAITLAAIKNRTTRVLVWLKKHEYEWNDSVALSAAMTGNVNTLEWLQENGYAYNMGKCATALEAVETKARASFIRKKAIVRAERSIRRHTYN